MCSHAGSGDDGLSNLRHGSATLVGVRGGGKRRCRVTSLPGDRRVISCAGAQTPRPAPRRRRAPRTRRWRGRSLPRPPTTCTPGRWGWPPTTPSPGTTTPSSTIPAALAAQKCFSTNLGGMIYRVGADTEATIFLGPGAIDLSRRATVVGGVLLQLHVDARGNKTWGAFGGMMNLALAFPVGDSLVHRRDRHLPEPLQRCGDGECPGHHHLGRLPQGNRKALSSVGFTGYNLINTYHPDLLPIGMVVGRGKIRGSPSASPATGWRNYGADGVHADRRAAGAEVFFFDMLFAAGRLDVLTRGRTSQLLGAGRRLRLREASAPSSPTARAFGGATFRTLVATLKIAVPGM